MYLVVLLLGSGWELDVLAHNRSECTTKDACRIFTLYWISFFPVYYNSIDTRV